MSAGRFVGSQELVKRPDALLKEVTSSGETCYITKDGKAKAVIMDINRYNALMDLVEETESPRQSDAGEETRELASVRVILKRNSGRYRR